MLKTNDEIIILDCIYKTNRYNIFLIILIEIICFNISFYFDICFLKNFIAQSTTRKSQKRKNHIDDDEERELN